MAVFVLTEDVVVSEAPLSWFSAGQGVVGQVADAEVLVEGRHKEVFRIPRGAVTVVAVPESLPPPPACCQHCGESHPEPAVWQTDSGKLVCNRCYARHYCAQGQPWKRFEFDPETSAWLKTAPLA